jgi:hypothetical protein
MPVPTEAFYDVAIKTVMAGEFINALVVAVGSAYIDIFDADDVLLAHILMNDPPGVVNSDGSMTFTTVGPDDSANASGTAAYMVLYDGEDVTYLTMPIVEGVAAQPGYLVMTSTTIIAGQDVAVTGFTIG